MKSTGKVYLIGAGPGDPGLVTIRARDLISRADLIVYDYLINPTLLRWAKPAAQKIYAGKKGGSHTLTQNEINILIVQSAKKGAAVVRLKGGDPFVFGRGGEEALELADAGVPFEIVPGVTSAIAAAAYAGIPVTHRDFSSSLTIVTGHENPQKDQSGINWSQLAKNPDTRVFLMGIERLEEISSRLLKEGAPAQTPAAVIRWGSTGRQRTITGTLKTIAAQVREAGLKAPAILVLGEVVSLRKKLNWFESLPLFGKRIVVTRTREQSSILGAQLQLLGADVLEIPMIRLVPVKLSEKQTSKLQEISRHYDWLVFTSPNAVDVFFKQFWAANEDVRALGNVQLAAVGPATAAKLKELHLKVEKQPLTFTTEELGRAFTAKEAAKKRFCLPRSNLANPELTAYLKKLGATVEEWTIYNTVPETADEGGVRARFEQEGADWITFASSSAVEAWHNLKLKLGVDAVQPKVASIGPVTTATLKQLGYHLEVEAEESTVAGLVRALIKKPQKSSPKAKLALK